MFFLLLLGTVCTKNTALLLQYNENLRYQPKSSTIKSTGNCGLLLTYSIINEKLIIEGSGGMTNYYLDSLAPW